MFAYFVDSDPARQTAAQTTLWPAWWRTRSASFAEDLLCELFCCFFPAAWSVLSARFEPGFKGAD
jgi:hypothetical protein